MVTDKVSGIIVGIRGQLIRGEWLKELQDLNFGRTILSKRRFLTINIKLYQIYKSFH